MESLSFDSFEKSNSEKDSIICKIFQNLSILKIIGIDKDQFKSFLFKVRENYHHIPYHNYSHAVDVCQFMYILFKNMRNKSIFAPEQVASLMFGALLHDIGHNGQDSNFNNQNFSHLTYVFGSESLLEHYHISVALNLIDNYILRCSDKNINNEIFCQLIFDSILSTDITKVQDFINNFNGIDSFDFQNVDHMKIVAQLLIQLSNVGNCFRNFEVHKKCSELLYKELNPQQKNIPQDFNLDEIEIKFIDQVANPLLQCIIKIMPEMWFLEQKLKMNKNKWNFKI